MELIVSTSVSVVSHRDIFKRLFFDIEILVQKNYGFAMALLDSHTKAMNVVLSSLMALLFP